jgi:hypothetical protein
MLSGKPEAFVKKGHDVTVPVPPVPKQQIFSSRRRALRFNKPAGISYGVVAALPDDLRFLWLFYQCWIA